MLALHLDHDKACLVMQRVECGMSYSALGNEEEEWRLVSFISSLNHDKRVMSGGDSVRVRDILTRARSCHEPQFLVIEPRNC